LWRRDLNMRVEVNLAKKRASVKCKDKHCQR
jgi:hypothetical protein